MRVATAVGQIAGAVGMLLVGGSARGFTQGEPTEGAVPGVSLRETAASLARSGAATNDARAVLAAAQIMITVERATPGLQRVGSEPRDSVRPEEAAKAGDFSAAGLLRLASHVAVEQQDVNTARMAAELAANREVGLGDAALAQELRQAASALLATRGAAGGPIWADGYLGTGAVAEYRITFQGGYVPNTVTVSASSARGDLDCYLYEGNQLVARDAGYGGDCSIKWSQKLKGTVTLRICNTGAGTYYTLVSN